MMTCSRIARWTAGLLFVVAAVALTACGSDDPMPAPTAPPAAAAEAPVFPEQMPPPVPTNTPDPTATPMPEPTNTPEPPPTNVPTAIPEPTAATTPEPAGETDVEERVAVYTEQCAELTAALETGPAAMGQTEADLTWGELAALTDLSVETYSQLEPPPEVKDYHDARLATLTAFRDHAKTRPSDDLMMMDIEELMTSVMPQVMVIGMDQSKTDAQKQEEIEQLMEEPLMNLLGPDLPAAAEAEEQARAQLPENLRNILDNAGCSSPDEGMAFP